MKLGAGAALGGVTLLVVACNAIIARDVVQCRTDKDCQTRADPNFEGSACVDDVCMDPLWCASGQVTIPQQDGSRYVRTRVRFFDIAALEPVEGAEVLVCPDTDVDCSTSEPIDGPLTTDAQGYVTADVPYAFRGTFYVDKMPASWDPAVHKGEFIKTILHSRRFNTEDEPADLSIEAYQAARLATRGDLSTLLGDVNLPFVDDKAIVFGAVYDCNDRPLPGAKVEGEPVDATPTATDAGPDRPITPFYDVNGTPTLGEKATGSSGIFGFFFAPRGQFAVKVRYGQFEWADARVVLVAGKLTTLGVRYSPGAL
ncbi:MAG: hypothetical protein KIT84_41950 [Labilithrix sp.]|nr:hypothetical protein [Labilithrix sp.]MCW5817638.1 hypothetical protein [Labilithrix sp.]